MNDDNRIPFEIKAALILIAMMALARLLEVLIRG